MFRYRLACLSSSSANLMPVCCSFGGNRDIPLFRIHSPLTTSCINQSNGEQFLQTFKQSTERLQRDMGYQNQWIQSNLSVSVKLPSSLHSMGTTTKEHHWHKDLCLTSSPYVSSFLISKSHLHQQLQESVSTESAEFNPGEYYADTKAAPLTFNNVRPEESFWILAVASLFDAELLSRLQIEETLKIEDGIQSRRQSQSTLKQYLFMLLNIVRLIRQATGSRIETLEACFGSQNSTNATVDHSVELSNHQRAHQYRESILRGNLNLYQVTYSLMRLNVRPITVMMSDSLQDITQIQYSLERQCATLFNNIPGHHYQMDDTKLSQLCQGSLLPYWQSVIMLRDASLLGNGAQSAAYLLGKDPQSVHYETARSLCANVATLLSLLDDYHCLKYQRLQWLDMPTSERWQKWHSPHHYMHFLLRLPVLLYLKERGPNSMADKQLDCRQLVTEVMENIELKSNSLPKVLALIEHHSTLAKTQLDCYQDSATKTALARLFDTCVELC